MVLSPDFLLGSVGRDIYIYIYIFFFLRCQRMPCQNCINISWKICLSNKQGISCYISRFKRSFCIFILAKSFQNYFRESFHSPSFSSIHYMSDTISGHNSQQRPLLFNGLLDWFLVKSWHRINGRAVWYVWEGNRSPLRFCERWIPRLCCTMVALDNYCCWQ